MPRRNKHKKDTLIHKATVYNDNYKAGCYGCAFAGKGFICLAEGQKCLKIKPDGADCAEG